MRILFFSRNKSQKYKLTAAKYKIVRKVSWKVVVDCDARVDRKNNLMLRRRRH